MVVEFSPRLGVVPCPGAPSPTPYPAMGPSRSTVVVCASMSEDRPPSPSLWLNPPPLAPGDGGEPVQQLQAALAQGGWNPGDIDGRYGNATIQAVTAFQAEQGLPATGIAGVETWQYLLLRLDPPQVLAAIPGLTVETLTFTPLVVAQPPPPPSSLWLLLMALIPLLGGGLTYLQHRWQAKHQR